MLWVFKTVANWISEYSLSTFIVDIIWTSCIMILIIAVGVMEWKWKKMGKP